MREKFSKLQKENRGSTLIIVLTVVAFLSILMVVVTSASLTNYKMKVVNKQSQKAFYTSEDAVDELYAALGKISMECFDEAYNEELSNIIQQIQVGDGVVSYNVPSITANANLRKNYTYQLVTKLGLLVASESINKYDQSNFVKHYNSEVEKQGFVTLLNSFLEGEGKDGLEIVSIANIEVIATPTSIEEKKDELNVYTLQFQDCMVKYRNDQSYFSDIVFTGELAMPDIYIDFASEKKGALLSFDDYALVGTTGIQVKTGKSLTLRGDAYAGKLTGFKLEEGSNVLADGIQLVTGGDIRVVNANLNTTASEIWCMGIFTEGTNGSKISITGGSTYVKDDLQLDGANSDVTIGGSYYGYSYQGNEVAEGNHNNSSAIIVNGGNSKVDLTGLSSLVIGGRAYIDYKTGAISYSMGESLSLKGTQEIYQVPSYMMSQVNPVIGDTSGVTVHITEDNFFGYQYLAPELYTSREVVTGSKTVTYYYFKFKDATASRDYVKAVLDDSTYETIRENRINGLSANGATEAEQKKVASDYDKARAFIQSVIQANIKSLNSTVISAGSGNIYSSGHLINAIFSDGNVDTSLGYTNFDYTIADNTYSTDGFILDSTDLSNRFELLTRVLWMPEFQKDGARNYVYEVGNYYDINGTGTAIDISACGEDNIFANFLALDKFKALTSKDENRNGYFNNAIAGYDGSVLCCAIDNSSGTITVSDEEGNLFKGYNSGIIIASGDVIVKKNFTGTIISGGLITIEDNVALTGDSVLVNALLNADENLKEILNSEGSDAVNGVESIEEKDYKDFVKFVNWRKSE